MALFDAIINDVGARFGLGANAAPLVREVVHLVVTPNGGLAGLIDKFKSAGLGSELLSWLGNTAGAGLTAQQVESVVSSSALGGIAHRLGLAGPLVASAVGYILPKVIGALTPGGVIPASLPAEVTKFLSPAAAVREASREMRGVAVDKVPSPWLWPVIGAATLGGIGYWIATNQTPVPVSAPAKSAADSASAVAGKAASLAGKARDEAAEIASKAGDKASDVASSASAAAAAARAVAGKAASLAGKARDEAAEIASKAGDKASDVASSASAAAAAARAVAGKAASLAGKARDEAAEIASKAGDKASDVASSASAAAAAARAVADKAASLAGKARDEAAEIASKAGDKASDVASSANAAAAAAKAVADKAANLAGKARDEAAEIASKAGDKIAGLGDKVSDTVASANANVAAALALLKAGSNADDIVAALNRSIINFATDGHDVPAAAAALLQTAAAHLKQAPAGTIIEIAGYTDDTGDAAANLALSQQRADAVRDVLISAGADPSILVAKGYGSANPVVSNATEEGRFQNRRIAYRVNRS
jgi:outer membrane protein OmpA-like peptidoglycan-associated protein/uncharacterized protein YidB (DUF937 family)